MKSRICQLLAPITVTAVASVLVMTGTPAALAATPGPVLGSLSFADNTGDPISSGVDATPFDVESTGPCADSTPNLQVYVSGSGFAAGGTPVTANNLDDIFQANPTTGGYDVPLENTLKYFASQQVPPATLNGQYTLTLICKDEFDSIESGSYVGSLWFTDPTHWQDTKPAADTSSTTVTLSASPATSAVAGAAVTLTATVAPSTATGTVQFEDGTTALGAPVTVTGGSASLVTSALAAGSHSLTANFTPSAPTAGTAATSAALPYTISVPAPVLTGASALGLTVGTQLTCPDGSKIAVPAAKVGGAIVCNGGGPDIAVFRGVLIPLVLPALSGSGKAGTRLVLSPGLWHPAATSRSVVWKRDGKVIAKQTGSSYLVTKSDKGHKISATVTVHRAGYADAAASTGGLKAKALLGSSGAEVATAPDASSTSVGVPVGTGIGCLAATFTGATSKSSQWLLDGAPFSSAVAIPLGDKLVGHVLTCRTTAINTGGTTVSDAVVKVLPGAALFAYVAPHITGVAKVGEKLAAATGKWYAAAAKVTFQWLRDGKVIKGATKATFVLPAADKGQRIAVRLTATRPGWRNGTATTAAVSVA